MIMSINSASEIAKVPTGITGLDKITGGGFPAGRSTLVCGGTGCGKTVLAMEFLVRGALEFHEPGLFVSFEESTQNLITNFKSFGFDLESLIEEKKLAIIDAYHWLESDEVFVVGDFTLDGLFIRLQQGFARIGAKRLVLDNMAILFTALPDTERLRGEIARLFRRFQDQDVTILVTAEGGKNQLTRHGIEEYVSDCVLLLDHRITEQISKRRLRIIKYRGTCHDLDEIPFLIGTAGISVLPVSSIELEYPAQSKRVSTGIADLDALLEGKGYYQGSSALVSGKAGTGKSTLAAAFAIAACAEGEPCLYFAFEESAKQLTRNMRSVGLDLAPWIEKTRLTVKALRPTHFGLEEHLVAIFKALDDIRPRCVVLDPITNFISIGSHQEINSMLNRVLHSLKSRGITVFLTALTPGSSRPNETAIHVSSVMDTWIALDLNHRGNTHRREIWVIKSRGMDHSRETHELILSSRGLSLRKMAADGSTDEPATGA